MAAPAPPPFVEALVRTDAFFTQCPSCTAACPSARPRDLAVNMFCPVAGVPACSLCPSGASSRLLQIRRSSYHDVVKVADLTRLAPGTIDSIQTYVINSSKVCFLRRRPQPRPPKGALGASQCTVCARHLADVADFCSLQCKLDGASGVRSILLTAPTTPSGEPVAAGEPTDSSPALPQVDHASPASSLAAPGGGAGGATACPAAKRLRRSGSAGSGAGQQPGTPARGSEEPCGGGGGAGSESGHGGGGGGGASSPAPATAGARRKRGAPPQRAHLQ